MMASENAHYLGGIANHWYSGDHFGELRALREVYPDLISIASEGCCAVTGEGIQPARELSFAEQYAHDICGCFNHGLHYYCDWNILLDEHNGPYHNRTGRGCSADAPMYAVAERDEVVYRLSYYYIGHYSKFVVPGASVVSSSSYDAGVESVAFKNPDGSVVCVLLNRTDAERRPILRLDGHIARLTLAPHSILTAVITR